MSRRLQHADPRRWPVAVTVPLIVALFMVAVGTILSHQVLRRLEQSQLESLSRLSSTYLDGLSAALVPSVIRGDVWEVFDVLDRASRRYEEVNSVEAVVVDASGRVVAASDPHSFSTDSLLPEAWLSRFGEAGALLLDEDAARAFSSRPLRDQGRAIGTIYAELDIADLLAERNSVLWTLIMTNAAITLLMAVVAYLVVRRTMRPLALLSERFGRARDGNLLPVPESVVARERGGSAEVLKRYNELVHALSDREQLAQRLAEEERLASLGRLASGLAHEINNPLGGMQMLVDTLAKHGEKPAVRKDSLALLERGLAGISNVVRSTLASYKGESKATVLHRNDLDDLRYLVQHEVVGRRLSLKIDNRLPDSIHVNGSAVRQAALNLLLNACEASPVGGEVELIARIDRSRLLIHVRDQGAGLPAEQAEMLRESAHLRDIAPRGSGLGLWMVGRLMRELGGSATVSASPGQGSEVAMAIPLEQLDEEQEHVA